jgi:serine/alanine adding enzyme
MKSLYNNAIPLSSWQKFLSTNPHASPFQSVEFFNLFNSVEGLSAEAIAITEGDSIKALAVITIQRELGIKSFFSKRGIIYGGPLIDNNYPEALDLLLNHITLKLKWKTIYVESRNFTNYKLYSQIFIAHGWNYIPYVNYQVNTIHFEEMNKKISDSRIRQIKKAIKSGVTWTEANSIEDVDCFYKILNDLYRNKIKKPLLPKAFFVAFYQQHLGKILLVKFKGMIIGGIMCPILSEKALYEFYICGLDNDFKEQYPSIMATWAAMEYAFSNKIPLFDFMGAGKPNENYGVRDFKSRFGGDLVEFGRYRKINSQLLFKAGEFGLEMMKLIRN